MASGLIAASYFNLQVTLLHSLYMRVSESAYLFNKPINQAIYQASKQSTTDERHTCIEPSWLGNKKSTKLQWNVKTNSS